MRIFLFLALATAIALALPQNEQTRRRGLRRFSLASPGLQSSVRRKEVEQDLVEESAVVTEAPQKTRGRGASLLRRGRPSRLRSKPAETETVQEQVEEKVVEAPPQRNTGGRGSIRIRRPIRKPTKATTTTTTTTSAPVTEDLIPDPEGEMNVDEAMIKDEAVDKTETKEMAGTEMKKDIPDEKIVPKSKDEKPETKPTKSLGPKLKLRPIPIKSARRKVIEETPEELPEMPKEAPSDQETTSSVSEPVSSHRFSSRPKPPRIQSRRRQSQAVIPQPVPIQQETKTDADPIEATARKRIGGRGSALRRPASRLSPRRKTAVQPEETALETPEETQGIDETPAARPTSLSRFPNVKELKSIVSTQEDTEGHQQSRKKPKRIRPKFKRPKTTTTTPKITTQPIEEILEEPFVPERTVYRPEPIMDPIPEVPVVQKGRQRGSNQPKLEVQEEVKLKFPTTNYGGSDLLIRGGEVQVTQIGTVEDSPLDEVRMILSGLGSRRRGLARPNVAKTTKKDVAQKEVFDTQIAASVNKENAAEDVDYLYEYYDYLYDEANV